MGTRRSLAYAAGGLGAAAVAAVATGVVVERRVVRARRAGAAEADRLGTLRSEPVEITCDDGVVLHAEIDEVQPYAVGTRRTPRRDSPWSSCTATPSTSTAGTSSARRSAASTGWPSTTSVRTVAPSGPTASTRRSTSSATTWRP